MKLSFFVFVLFLSSNLFSQEQVKITLKVYAPSLSDSDKVYIAGNIPSLGNWQPGRIQLTLAGNKTWYILFYADRGIRIEYKYTKGSWASEALGNDSTVPQNTILIPVNDTTVKVTINNWRDNFSFNVKGQVTGKVVYHKDFAIEGLKPRDIFVWLPPNYNEQPEKYYPVFYMHDGQNLIDPRKSNTFIDWQVDETADSLIRKGEVVPFIIVGINNTEDRGVEYNNTPLGKLYEKLIIEKIKPFIDTNYRTLKDAGNTAIGGSSMGGLISLMIAWDYPSVFSKAACFSPAFKFQNFDYTKVIENDSSPKKNIIIYIDNGGIGLETILQPGIEEMIRVLGSKGYTKEKELRVLFDKTAEHNEAAWAKRVWRPIKMFFGVNKNLIND